MWTTIHGYNFLNKKILRKLPFITASHILNHVLNQALIVLERAAHNFQVVAPQLSSRHIYNLEKINKSLKNKQSFFFFLTSDVGVGLRKYSDKII